MSTYRNLINEIDHVIRTYGKQDADGYYLSWKTLNDQTKGSIVALFIEEDDRDLNYCINENEKFDYIVASLLLMLKKDTREASEDFSTCLKNNLFSYYAKKAQELIDERCKGIESDALEDAGLTRYRNRETGHSHILRI